MKIKWIGGERTAPKIGILQNNKEYDLPEDAANDFIKQGLAKKITTKKQKRKKGSK